MTPQTHLKSSQQRHLHPESCETCTNQRCPIKSQIPQTKLGKINILKTNHSYKKGQQILFENSSVIGIYFIYSGKIKVFKQSGLRSERVLRFSGPGDVLGHRGYGDTTKYPISATCLEDCSLCQFNTTDFFKIAKNNASFTFQLMMTYAAELHGAEQRLFQQTELTAKERLLDVVVRLYNQFGITKHNLIDLPITRGELASIVGLTYETSIRILSELKRQKILFFKGTHIEILDMKYFQQFETKAKH